MEEATVIALTANRKPGFGLNFKSANQAYKEYTTGATANSETPKPFKQWLDEEQKAGRYLRADHQTKDGNWKQQADDKTKAAQPVINATEKVDAPPGVAAAVNSVKTDTAVQLWRPLGMHPIGAVIVVGATIYIVYRILK